MTAETTTKMHVAYIGGTRYVADPDRDCCYWANPDRDGSIDEDRATLFAAAPELLEACRVYSDIDMAADRMAELVDMAGCDPADAAMVDALVNAAMAMRSAIAAAK